MTSIRIHARRRRLVDPTQTATLRKRYMGETARRFDAVARAIRELIVDDDAFGLAGLQTNRPKGRRFLFPTREAKINAFLDWLADMEQSEILAVRAGVPVQRAARQAWTHVYIESAYQKGLADAARKLRDAGADVRDSWIRGAFQRPIHADRVGIAFTRAYELLEHVTTDMSDRMGAALARGLAEGRGPRDLSRQLVDVTGISKRRAQMVARTEVIHAHAEATLNAYEEAAVEGVEVEAELMTARDGAVCSECRALEGEVIPMARARNLIPVHPNCRCAWLPAVIGARGVTLNRKLRTRGRR